LLVGVDHYERGSRPIELRDLHGCVNDVVNMNKLLRILRFDYQKILVSPIHSFTAEGHQQPLHGVDLPTFDNIQASLKSTLLESYEGDLFFLHFSGHGAPLRTVAKSPMDGRKEDPSLLPMDFGRGKLALRGWQLNALLKPFCEKGIHVVVSLDSCFSGGSWRYTHAPRSPTDWAAPPNLPSDELVEEDPVSSQENRHGKLDTTWDINAEGLIVMTACASDQVAQEVDRDGKIYGAFTYELYHLLSRCAPVRLPMYYNIRNHIASHLPSQTPHVFGKDKMVFLETKETSVLAPVRADIRGGRASLPIGRIHGVVRGAVFVSRLSESDVFLKLDDVSDFTSEGGIQQDMDEEMMEFVPFQWYSEKVLVVGMDSNLETSFGKILQDKLQERIASRISIEDNEATVFGDNAKTINFRLWRKNDNELCISGPAMLGDEGSVHGPDLGGASMERNIVMAADALAHLFRFCQISELSKETSLEAKKFTAFLSKQSSPENPLSEGQKLEYTFKNEDRQDLYLTVLNLGPGFQVAQLFPPENMPERIPPGRTKTLGIAFSIPPQLEDSRPYRDVIRTIVTRGETQGFKSLELPDIWDAATMDSCKREQFGRSASIRDPPSTWWVVDHEVYTERSL
jgi:hypothetical protein